MSTPNCCSWQLLQPDALARVVQLSRADEPRSGAAPRPEEIFARLFRAGETIVLDLGEVRALDPEGLALVLRAWNACAAAGGRLCLARLSPACERLLAQVGLAGLSTRYATVEEALRAGRK